MSLDGTLHGVRSRRLQPGFAGVLGTSVVLIDHNQPVLATLNPHGDVDRLIEWGRVMAPPEYFTWPNRRVLFATEETIIHDLASPSLVSLSTGGRIRILAQDQVPDGNWRYPRIWGSSSRRKIDRWEFRNSIEIENARSSVLLRSETKVRYAGHLIEAAAVGDGDVAIVAIKEAAKRPWNFSPARTVYRINGAARETLEMLEMPTIEDRCWPARSPREDELADYMSYACHELSGLMRMGSSKCSLSVLRDEVTVIEHRFSLPGFKNVEFVRLDQPFDELGNLAGLRAMNVSLEEDISGGLPERMATAQKDEPGISGVVRI